tara:strand:- start:1779 stop:3305 length:1527 start_codon:yes stop_codon:yes gene_type:complete
MTCNICCEKFNKSLNAKITCICGFDACKTCVRTYLLSTTKDPHCMDCKTQWSAKFLVDNLNRSYIDGDYKKHRKILLVDREISKTPELMNLVERTKLIEDKSKELLEFDKEFKEVRKIYFESLNKLNLKRVEINKIKNGEVTQERKKFIMPCPGDNCKGYLSTQYKCEVCKLYTCPDCYEIVGYTKDEPHTCLEANLQSAALIKKETKGCPHCGVRIFKISGCDQMWCTECKVAFNWNTGKVIYGGQIHNPHYYQYMRNQNNGEQAPRNPGDVLCGGLVPYYTLTGLNRFISSFSKPEWFNTLKTYNIVNKFIQEYDITSVNTFTLITMELHRVINHITNVNLIHCRQKVRHLDNNDELTVQYILNRKTKQELATNILKNDTARKKHTELLNIYELLSVIGIEKFNNLSHIYSKISIKDSRKIDDLINVLHSIISLITEYNTLLEYCNKQFVEISKTYNQSVIIVIYKPDICRYELKTGKFKESDLTAYSNKKRKGNNNHEASSSKET